MCGIAGVFNHSGVKNSIAPEILKKMSDAIIERGPDSDGSYISDNGSCGLTFRRLAIIDLSPLGNQPMISSDGNYAIVFNGEIYNHSEIRQELMELGYQYKSATDTETILYGYRQWGAGILNKMLGMWAIAIYDKPKGKLFVARDRIGIKPLYYYNHAGNFIFGSEIKSIFCHPAVHKNLNLNELPNYLNFGLSSNRTTLFEGIYKIPPAHYAEISSDGNFKLERYWHPFNEKLAIEVNSLSDKQLQDKTLDMLRDAVKARMMSDVPFGVFLSGGIDSSVNVALMSELMSRPVDTFTVGFKELEKYNELKYARQISALFKTNHNEILIDDKDSLAILDTLAWREDEPNADPVCIPLFFLSKLTREKGTIVVQVGEGSDEQFAGYPWIIQHYNVHKKYWNKYGALPKFLRQAAYSVSKPILNSTHRTLALDYIRRAANGEQFYWSGVSIFSPSHLDMLFGKTYKSLCGIPAKYADSLHKEVLELFPKADYYQRMVYLELNQRLAEILLMRVDKVTMSHSIEARVPFLDHKIVEFTTSLRADKKMPDGKTTKYILKKAAESILPQDIIYRRKQGFAAPVEEWLRNQWFSYASDEILNSYFVRNGIFCKEYVERLLASHRKSKANYSQQIFSLLMLSIWAKKHF